MRSFLSFLAGPGLDRAAESPDRFWKILGRAEVFLKIAVPQKDVKEV